MSRQGGDHSGMFTVGHAYTRDEVHDALGSSKHTYLPTLDGKVFAVFGGCELNPQAPDRFLIGTQPRVIAAGEALADQAGPLPVFLKRRSNEWVYQVRYEVADVCRDAGRRRLVAAGRDALHMPIDLELADE